jgi:DNA-binding response OmpR family regulator
MEKKKEKILIIEDEKFLLEMYQSRFEKAGYQVLTARTGKPGIKIAEKEKPDLIILDILMPEMDGYEVIKKIREDSQTKKIPVLVLSNLGQQEEVNQGLKLGADDYVIKTDLTPTELLDKVERMFSRLKKPSKKLKKRVLIIEDEKEIAQLYQEKLVKEGFEIEVANNGAWGLRLASHGDFDIILLDMVMPAFNGYEAIKELKKDPRTAKVPVLVFSNSAQEGEISQALKIGAEDYFIKSRITPTQMVKEVKKILKNK